MEIVFAVLFFISFLMAARSMKDFDVPKELRNALSVKKVKGSLVFFKDRITHHSSDSSSS
jgi:hypothetical protein